MMIGYVLLALGIAVFVLSFVIPAKTDEEKTAELSGDMIKEMVDKEVESAKTQITDLVDETITYAMEKTERSMERLTNEKITAVNEYSDTVLSEINKNHQEVVFLYDMLNDKHENLKDTVASVEKTASEVKQAVKDAELTVKEVSKEAEEISQSAAPAYEAPIMPEIVEEEPSGNDILAAMDNWENLSDDLISDDEAFAGNASESIAPVSDEPENNTPEPEYPQENGRISAIDRLKAAKKAEHEEFKPIIIERVEPDSEVNKKPKKKRAEKDAEDELLSYVATRAKSEAPDLNLGENPVGRTGGRNNNERILELHDAGKSNMAIAKELGLGIGEVKLVIDLFEGM